MTAREQMDAAIIGALRNDGVQVSACVSGDRAVFIAGMQRAAEICKANDADYSHDLITAEIEALEAENG